MARRPHVCGHPKHGSTCTITLRRATLLFWPLILIIALSSDVLGKYHLLGALASALCALALVLNVPEVTYLSLQSARNYDDIRHNTVARPMFIITSTILIPMYIAALYETVYSQYGNLHDFNQLPYILQFGILRGTFSMLRDIHKVVGSASINISHWYSKCFPESVAVAPVIEMRRKKRSRSAENVGDLEGLGDPVASEHGLRGGNANPLVVVDP